MRDRYLVIGKEARGKPAGLSYLLFKEQENTISGYTTYT